MNGEGQWLLLAATKTPTNHALDTKRRMWRLQMDATMPSLGQLGRSANDVPNVNGTAMRIQFGIAQCATATLGFAVVFATLQLPRAVAQTSLLLEIWIGFHFLISWRHKCYASIFVGIIIAFITGLFFPHVSGSWTPGRPWIEMLDPYQLVTLAAMLGVGGFAQTLFARAYIRELDEAARSAKRRAKRYQFRDLPP